MISSMLPSRRSRTRLTPLLVAGSMMAVCLCASSLPSEASTASSGDRCVFTTAVPAELPERCDDPGDIIGLDGGDGTIDVGVVVPDPGHTTTATLEYIDGGSTELSVSSDGDGAEAQAETTGSAGSGGSNNSPNECADDAYAYDHANSGKLKRIYGSLNWYYNPQSTPSYMTTAQAEASLQDAARRIADTVNNCEPGDFNPIPANYLGRINKGVGVPQQKGTCGTPDGYSVVLFGPITTPNILALTCTFSEITSSTISENITEADMRFNSNIQANGVAQRWWFSGNTCSGDFSLTAVATHEFGHAYGMAHVGELDHANLTMSRLIAPCSTAAATLGLGDYLGLYRLYN